MNARNLSLLAVALAACAHAQPQPAPPSANPAQVLETPPQVGPIEPFNAPVPAELKLANGLSLFTLVRPQAPLETLIFTSKHGAVHDGALPGLASLSGELLQTGSAGRSASQIATEVAALGTSLHVGASREDLTGILTVLPAELPQAAALLGDVMLRPNLDPKELQRTRQQRQARLVSEADDPHFVASRVFGTVVFGDSPYGTPLLGTQASIAKIKLADVKRFLGKIGTQNAALFAAGPVPAEQLQALLDKAFGAAQPGQAEAPIKATPASHRPALVLVDKPGAPQSVLRMGEPSVAIHSPDRWALELDNLVFGGSFTSRINQNLREKHGYTYGARSDFQMLRGGGAFLAAADVKTSVTAASIKELQGELARMAQSGLSPEELTKSRALFAAGLVQELQTTPGTAQAIAELWADELPLDDLAKVLPALKQLDLAAVNAAWNRAVNPQAMTLVVVGDAKSVKSQLQAAGLPAPTELAAPR